MTLTGSFSKGSNGTRYGNYHSKSCDTVEHRENYSKAELEANVESFINEIKLVDGYVEGFRHYLKLAYDENIKAQVDSQEIFKGRVKTLQEELELMKERLLKIDPDNIVAFEIYTEKVKNLQIQIKEAQTEASKNLES